MITTSNYLHIKKMKKCISIEHLFEKMDLPCKLNDKKDGMGLIQNIKSVKSYAICIQSFIEVNYRKFSNRVKYIIDL